MSDIVATLKQRFAGITHSEFRGQSRVVVAKSDAFAALQLLKSTGNFDLLVDVTCVDYLNFRDAPNRFGLVYLLANTTTSERLTVRVYLGEEDLTIPSVVSIWKGADWMEREVYDMFGIEFTNHGDLRRILMPDEFTAFPLRKDYPMQGRGERHNFPVIQRDRA
jgi:NADH-quinone oxidoreductase subunit C